MKAEIVVSLSQLFPEYDQVRVPRTGLPQFWAHVLSLPTRQGLSKLARFFGPGDRSRVYEILMSCADYAVLVPRRRREQGDRRMWRLAVLRDSFHALLFHCPCLEYLNHFDDLPVDYVRIVTELGAFQFDQYSGQLIWPAFAEKIAHEIEGSIEGHHRHESWIPFYDHRTGDYDCWRSREFGAVWQYCHETQEFQSYCQGAFMRWFEKRFLESIESSQAG